MNEGLQFNAEVARRIEELYRTPDVAAQRQAALRVLGLTLGERVLDVGSGPGLLALEMGLAVGPTGTVCGIDISEDMILMSRTRCAGLPWVGFQTADATTLPFPDNSFDAAVATQVYEYVGDMTTALAELYRVLCPGGRALILDTDWDSIVWHSSDRARMERVLLAWDEHLDDPHLPRTLPLRLTRAGLQLKRHEVIPLFNSRYEPNTYSHGIIREIVSFVAGKGVSKEEARAWADDLRTLGEAGSYFFSLNRYLFLAVKPEEAQPDPAEPMFVDPQAAKAEAARLEAARAEAARIETLRQEADRLAAENAEALRAEAARLEAARAEATNIEAMIEAMRQEAAQLEATNAEATKVESARLAAARAEVSKIEALRHEAERLEAANVESARAEVARLEAARAEAARIGAAKIEAAREAARQEAARAEAARLAAAKAEAARIKSEAAKAPAKPEQKSQAVKPVVTKADAAKPEPVKPEPPKPDSPKPKSRPQSKDDSIIWID